MPPRMPYTARKAKDTKGTLLRTVKMLKPFRVSIIIIMLAVTISTVFSILAPVFMYQYFSAEYIAKMFNVNLLTYKIESINTKEFLEPFIVIGSSYIIAALFSFIAEFSTAKLSGSVTYSLRKQTKEKIDKFLAYGADVHDDYNSEYLKEFNLIPDSYYLLVARLEPENNIVMAIEGYLASKENGCKPLVIIGKTNTPHGKELVAQYGREKSIRFMGGIYDFKKLNSIRKFSFAYFHGHSVGGTNPSLLEAMASDCFILANDNIFNRAVLKNNAEYYHTVADVRELLNDIDAVVARDKDNFINGNLKEIRTEYSWEHLVDEHEKYFKWLLAQKH